MRDDRPDRNTCLHPTARLPASVVASLNCVESGSRSSHKPIDHRTFRPTIEALGIGRPLVANVERLMNDGSAGAYASDAGRHRAVNQPATRSQSGSLSSNRRRHRGLHGRGPARRTRSAPRPRPPQCSGSRRDREQAPSAPRRSNRCSPRVWIETRGPPALGLRSTRSMWWCGNSPDRHHRGKGSEGCL
jgi:hypothetical protein